MLLVFLLYSDFSFSQVDFWQQSNGPYGGHIWKILANSQDHLFAATYSRLFKSTDSGATWHTCLLDSMWVESISGLCFDSTGRFFIGHTYGVIVSTDEGETWKETGPMPIPCPVRAFAIDSTGTLIVGTWQQGFFRSTNHGETWMRCSADSLTALCLYVNRQTNVILAGSEQGIYRSSDGGLTWSIIYPGDRSYMAFLKHPSGALYVISSSDRGGLYKSTNDGLTWTELSTPLRYCESLVSTKSGRIIVGSAWGMYMSDDLGVTWYQKGLMNEVPLTLWFDGTERLYAGTGGGGVYISTDEGDHWKDINTGILAAHIGAVAADDHGNVYVAWHKKVDRSQDFGATFKGSFESSSAEVTTVAVDSKGNVFSIVMDTIFVSTDHGSSWQVACATGIWQPPWALSADPDDNLFTVTRSAAVYRSTDQGHHWTCVRGGGGGAAFYLNIAFTPDGTGFFTVYDPNPPYGMVFRSTDRGFTWIQIAQNLQTNGIQSFCIDRQGVIFLGTNGLGVQRSTDKGTSWSESNTGLPSTDRWVRFIVAAGNELLVNTSSYYYPPGFTTYRSTNNGQSWIRESSGLPNDFVTALTATPSGYFYAGTQYNGLYRSHVALDAVSADREIKGFSLLQNYPNPFNPSTIIGYTLPHNSYVTLTIYNLLGQQTTKLVNGYQQAGFHEAVFRGDGLSSGIYLYRLQVGLYSETKKFLLLR